MTDGNTVSDTLILTLLLLLLAAVVVTDLRSHRIPNLLVFPAIGISLMVHALTSGLEGVIFGIGGLAVGAAILMPLYLIGGMAAGDVKLLGAVGSFLGPWGALVAGLATMMAGAVIGIGVIFWQRFRLLLQPYLEQLLGSHGTMTNASSMLKGVGKQPAVTKIAYSPAIASGTLLALWYMKNSSAQLLGQG